MMISSGAVLVLTALTDGAVRCARPAVHGSRAGSWMLSFDSVPPLPSVVAGRVHTSSFERVLSDASTVINSGRDVVFPHLADTGIVKPVAAAAALATSGPAVSVPSQSERKLAEAWEALEALPSRDAQLRLISSDRTIKELFSLLFEAESGLAAAPNNGLVVSDGPRRFAITPAAFSEAGGSLEVTKSLIEQPAFTEALRTATKGGLKEDRQFTRLPEPDIKVTLRRERELGPNEFGSQVWRDEDSLWFEIVVDNYKPGEELGARYSLASRINDQWAALGVEIYEAAGQATDEAGRAEPSRWRVSFIDESDVVSSTQRVRLRFDAGGGSLDFLVAPGETREQLAASFESRDVKSSRIVRRNADACRSLLRAELCGGTQPLSPPAARPEVRREPATQAFVGALSVALKDASRGSGRPESLASSVIGQRIVERFDQSAIGRPVLLDGLVARVGAQDAGAQDARAQDAPHYTYDPGTFSRFSAAGRDRTVQRGYVEALQAALTPEVASKVVFRWNELYDLQYDLDNRASVWVPRPQGTAFDVVLPGMFKADASKLVAQLNEELLSTVPPLRDPATGAEWRLQARQPQMSQLLDESVKYWLLPCKPQGKECVGVSRLIHLSSVADVTLWSTVW